MTLWRSKTVRLLSKLIVIVLDSRRVQLRQEERDKILMAKISDLKIDFDAFKVALAAKLAELEAGKLSAEDQAAIDAIDADLKSGALLGGVAPAPADNVQP